MFSTEERSRIRDLLVTRGKNDPRIVAAAEIGAAALEAPDRWSDIDLTFGVREGVPISEPLKDWTSDLEAEQSAVRLFDLPFLSTVYRVFLFPGSLQVDLSFTPAAEFGPLGPKFRLLFGRADEREEIESPDPSEVFGLGVHHAVRARLCIERQRFWQAEYWIHSLRDHVLELACLHRNLESAHGRGFDQLPADIRSAAGYALVRSIDRNELLRAMEAALRTLVAEARAGDPASDLYALIDRIEPQLRELLEPTLQVGNAIGARPSGAIADSSAPLRGRHI